MVVSDNRGHGTNCAGIIASRVGNYAELDASGVAPEVTIVPMKVLNSHGWGGVMDAVDALGFLAKRSSEKNYYIVNASWGTTGCSRALTDAIKEVTDEGSLVVAAAGNNGDDLEICPYYPASYAGSSGAVLAVSAAKLKQKFFKGQALLREGAAMRPK